VSPELINISSASSPATPPAPARATLLLSVLGSPLIAAVKRFGWAGAPDAGADEVDGDDGGAGGLAQLTASISKATHPIRTAFPTCIAPPIVCWRAQTRSFDVADVAKESFPQDVNGMDDARSSGGIQIDRAIVVNYDPGKSCGQNRRRAVRAACLEGTMQIRRIAWGAWYGLLAFGIAAGIAYGTGTLDGSWTPVALVLAALAGFGFGYVVRQYAPRQPPKRALLVAAWVLWLAGAVWLVPQGATTTTAFWVSLAGMIVLTVANFVDWQRQRNQPAV
jgi:hypothetical protein